MSTPDRSPNPTAPNRISVDPPGSNLRFADLLLILAAAGFWPWSVAAQNVHDMAHPWRLLGLVVGLFAIGALVVLALTGRGVRVTTATYSVFLALVVFMVGGRFIRALGAVAGWALVVAVLVGFPLLLSRMESHVVPRILMAAVAVALVAGPAVTSVSAALSWRESEVERSDVARDLVLDDTPDIALFILDGHPGAIAWDLDLPPDEAFIFSDLESRGFDVVESAWSPYWTTSLAVPSLLDMGYPLVMPPGNGATNRDLNDMLSGDNALATILEANGYRLSVVGSGWSGLRCTRHFDDCWDSPLLDDVLFFTLNDSLLAPWLVGRFGHAFTHGVSEAMEQLPRRIEELSSSDAPTFLLAHLIAPHPPPFLDADCRIDINRERLSVAAGPHRVDQDLWNGFFLEQVTCVDRFVLQMIERFPPDTVVIVVSDHGTDRRGQSVEGAEWGRDEAIERLNVLAAARTGALECGLPDDLVLPNLFRTVLECLSDTELGALPIRMFSNPAVEIPGSLVDELVNDSD